MIANESAGMKNIALGILVAFLLLLPISAAKAAESRKELGLRLDALTQRIMMLEDRMLTGDPAAIQLQQRLDTFELQMRNQVGENERLRFENKRQREDINALRLELELLNKDVKSARDDAKAAKSLLGGYITGGVIEMPVEQAQEFDDVVIVGEDGAGPATASSKFADARKLLESGFFDQAYNSLQTFVLEFPKDDLSGEALYWLGEIQMVRGDAAKAADHYLQSLKDFRKGSRAPDAMVKLAAAFAMTGDIDEACQTLKLFPSEYPAASAAVKTKADIEKRRAGCTP